MSYQIAACVVSDVGKVRAINEDSGLFVQPVDETERRERGVLALVADGMGGHAAGELASRLAVETIPRAYYAAEGEPGAALSAAFQEANRAIFERAGREPHLAGMGTTSVALALCGGDAHAASVGDSRLYLIRGGQIYQMTEDDSAASELVTQGQISRADARMHPSRNVILQALGTHATVSVHNWPRPFPVRVDDTFVLCSDGLTDLATDDEIRAATHDRHEADACRALIDLAHQRGGYDNITVAIVRVLPVQTGESTVPPTREIAVQS